MDAKLLTILLMSLEPHVVVWRPMQAYMGHAGPCWGWQPFSDTFASCNMELLAEGVSSGISISAISSGIHLLFFIWEEVSLHLPRKANVHKQSGLKQRKRVQGQINRTAVIRKLSTVFLVLTHSRSDLIGSRHGFGNPQNLEVRIWGSRHRFKGRKNWREGAVQQ